MKNRILELRRQIGITQQFLADKVGISKAAVAQYESGRIKTIKPEHLSAMSKVFGKSPAYIAGFSNLPYELTDDEVSIVKQYRALNTLGKYELRQRLWELSQIWDYTSGIITDTEEAELEPIAAHADDVSTEILKGEIERIRKLIDAE